jgi:hypothetical protein
MSRTFRGVVSFMIDSRSFHKCVSTQLGAFGKNVAEWSNEASTLRVAERFEPILDRIVVTCILNLWMKQTAAGW